MPGSGVNSRTIGKLWPRLAIDEIHASCSVAETETDDRLLAFGFSAQTVRRTDAATVKALKAHFA
jgi:copper homeostasis protein